MQGLGDDAGSELKVWVRETMWVHKAVIVTHSPWSKNRAKWMVTEVKGSGRGCWQGGSTDGR